MCVCVCVLYVFVCTCVVIVMELKSMVLCIESSTLPLSYIASNHFNKCFCSLILKRIQLIDMSCRLNLYPSTCWVNMDRLFFFDKPPISQDNDTSIYIAVALRIE